MEASRERLVLPAQAKLVAGGDRHAVLEVDLDHLLAVDRPPFSSASAATIFFVAVSITSPVEG